MNSFTDTVKRHGLILWLCHVLQSLIVFGLIMGLVMAGLLTTLGIGVSSMFSVTMENILKSVQDLGPWVFGGGAIGLGIIAVFAYLLAYSFGEAGAVAVTTSAVARDEATFQTFFREGLQNMWRMFGLWIASFIILIPVILVCGGAIVLFTLNSPGLGSFLVLLALVLLILVILGLMFSQYILIAEKETIWRSIGASFSLLGKQFGQVLITGLILIGVSMIFSIPMYGLTGDGGSAAVLNPFYDLLISPIIATIITLILVYRYYRYMRPALYPAEVKVVESVIGDVDDEMDKTEQ